MQIPSPFFIKALNLWSCPKPGAPCLQGRARIGLLITARAQLSMFSSHSLGVAEESRVSTLKINKASESTSPVAGKLSFYIWPCTAIFFYFPIYLKNKNKKTQIKLSQWWFNCSISAHTFEDKGILNTVFVVTIVAPVLPLIAALRPKEKGQMTAEVKRIWKLLEPLHAISEALFRLTDFLKQLITSPLHWRKEEHQNYNFHITLKAGNARLSSHTLQLLGTSMVHSRHKQLLGLSKTSNVPTEEAVHPRGRLTTTTCLPTSSRREMKYRAGCWDKGEGYAASGVEKSYFN